MWQFSGEREECDKGERESSETATLSLCEAMVPVQTFAVTALSKADGHGALYSLGPVRGSNSDGESKSRSKATMNVNSGVEVGDGAKKCWANQPLVSRHVVLDLDIINTKAAHKNIKGLANTRTVVLYLISSVAKQAL
jgi:hypothetical protein